MYAMPGAFPAALPLMRKISAALRRKLEDGSTEPDADIRLIITLSPRADWTAAVAALVAAGLRLEREAGEIHALFGQAPASVIAAIAQSPDVELVETEGSARALQE